MFLDSINPPTLDIMGRHFLLDASIAILPNGSCHLEFPIAISDFS